MPSPLELLTDQDYIDFLTREYGWKIEGPTHTTAPTPKQEYIGQNQRELELITHYLTKTYIIQDQFDKDPAARRLFLEELKLTKPNVKEWIESHSKLKKNRIDTNVLWPISTIVQDLEDTFPELYQRLQYTSDLYSGIRRYDTMPFDEKAAYVKKVDEAAYRFLEELAK